MQKENIIIFLSAFTALLGFLFLFTQREIAAVILFCTSLIIISISLSSDSNKLNRSKKWKK
ncbi:MAG: hypothetical protein WC758_07575 [Candidatus Woesearchaeota archaeon]